MRSLHTNQCWAHCSHKRGYSRPSSLSRFSLLSRVVLLESFSKHLRREMKVFDGVMSPTLSLSRNRFVWFQMKLRWTLCTSPRAIFLEKRRKLLWRWGKGRYQHRTDINNGVNAVFVMCLVWWRVGKELGAVAVVKIWWWRKSSLSNIIEGNSLPPDFRNFLCLWWRNK